MNPTPVTISCPLGHTFTVSSMAKVKPGYCPFCSGNRAWPGFNDLATTHPEVASWWDHSANSKTPDTVLPGSTYKASWRCPQGHTWEAKVCTQVGSGKCPFCSGRKVWPGFNDLATVAPEVAAEFDSETAGHGPDQVCAQLSTPVPWECHHGHTWQASPRRRVADGNGCPYCSGNKVWPGFNDLATTHPELAAEFDTDATGFGPDEITAGSSRKVSWKCHHDHSWSARLSERTRRNPTGCPYCSGRQVVPGETDLATTHPSVASWWDQGKNTLTPSEVAPKSNKKAWWVCPEGHSFSDQIAHMTVLGLCPYCIGRRILVGFNDLATTHPELAEQWDAEANGDLTAEQVSGGSKRRIHWICPRDSSHRWVATPNTRTGRGDGCPECWASGRSGAESELAEFIEGIIPAGAEMIRNSRDLIKPFELDVYLPEFNLAIEFNGVWWHSEAYVGRDRHYEKWRRCSEAGVQLLTVWEDDWRDKRPVVESMLTHKLGLSDAPRVGARECSVVNVTAAQAREFLNARHIQGAGHPGSIRIALAHPEHGLVAVSAWRRDGETAYLDRYATSARVSGGMGRLLAAGRRWAREAGLSKIVTFADHSVSDGGLYERLGFAAEAEIPPDYCYVVNATRQHKFGYRLARFRSDPTLEYQEGLSERELAELNQIPRLWDSGKTRWAMTV